MPTSSARPDYLQRYAMFVADRTNAARLASTRAAVAMATYTSSSTDMPITVGASAATDTALARSDGMITRVQRVAAAFTLADRSDRIVVVVDDGQLGRAYLGTGGLVAVSGRTDDDSPAGVRSDRHAREILYQRGGRMSDDGTHRLGPADLKGEYEVFAGAEVTRTSFFDVDGNGLAAVLEMEAFAGLRMQADGTLEAGPVSGRGHVEASIGAEATANAHARINRDEIHADLSGGAFVGAKGSVDAELEAMGVEGKAAAEVRAGFGAEFSGEGHIGLDKVGFELSGGLAMGLGGGGNVAVTVNPRETASDVVRVTAGVRDDAGRVVSHGADLAVDAYDDGRELAGDVYDGGEEIVEDTLDFIDSPLGTGTVRFDLGPAVVRSCE